MVPSKPNMLNQLWIIAIVVLGLSMAAASCPNGWISSPLMLDSCFYYIPLEATFNDAKKACRHLKGELVVPQSQLDTASMSDILQRSEDITERRNVWVDMKKVAGENRWTSVNGSEISPDWHVGYPEGDGECGVFLYSNAKMKNKVCSLHSSILCKAMKETAPSIKEQCPPTVQGNSTHALRPGTYVYLECEQGYQLSETGHRKMYCRRDGDWSKTSTELAKCIPESCEMLVVGDGVKELTEGGNSVGLVRNFTCPSGAAFKTKQNSKYVLAECTAEGSWVSNGEQTITMVDDCVPQDVKDSSGPKNSATKCSISWFVAIVTYLTAVRSL